MKNDLDFLATSNLSKLFRFSAGSDPFLMALVEQSENGEYLNLPISEDMLITIRNNQNIILQEMLLCETDNLNNDNISIKSKHNTSSSTINKSYLNNTSKIANAKPVPRRELNQLTNTNNINNKLISKSPNIKTNMTKEKNVLSLVEGVKITKKVLPVQVKKESNKSIDRIQEMSSKNIKQNINYNNNNEETKNCNLSVYTNNSRKERIVIDDSKINESHIQHLDQSPIPLLKKMDLALRDSHEDSNKELLNLKSDEAYFFNKREESRLESRNDRAESEIDEYNKEDNFNQNIEEEIINTNNLDFNSLKTLKSGKTDVIENNSNYETEEKIATFNVEEPKKVVIQEIEAKKQEESPAKNFVNENNVDNLDVNKFKFEINSCSFNDLTKLYFDYIKNINDEQKITLKLKENLKDYFIGNNTQFI